MLLDDRVDLFRVRLHRRAARLHLRLKARLGLLRVDRRVNALLQADNERAARSRAGTREPERQHLAHLRAGLPETSEMPVRAAGRSRKLLLVARDENVQA